MLCTHHSSSFGFELFAGLYVLRYGEDGNPAILDERRDSGANVLCQENLSLVQFAGREKCCFHG